MPTCHAGSLIIDLWNWKRRIKFERLIKLMTHGRCQGGGQNFYRWSCTKNLYPEWVQESHHGGDRQCIEHGEKLPLLLL